MKAVFADSIYWIATVNPRDKKEYSLIDCISMNAMRTESLVEALTNDHHF